MAAEAFTGGTIVLGIGGLVAFVAGALFLFDPSGADIRFGVALPLVLAAAIVTGLLAFFHAGPGLAGAPPGRGRRRRER